MILYSEQCLSRCESFSRPPSLPTIGGAHFYTPSSVFRDAGLSPILLDAPFIFQQLEGMADDALPQTIRHALGTAFKKKPADTLDQWAALCAKAGMDDVDDVASCRAEDFDTWIGRDCIVLTNFLRRLHTPAQQCPQSMTGPVLIRVSGGRRGLIPGPSGRASRGAGFISARGSAK